MPSQIHAKFGRAGKSLPENPDTQSLQPDSQRVALLQPVMQQQNDDDRQQRKVLRARQMRRLIARSARHR
jgi:hypothetical protein